MDRFEVIAARLALNEAELFYIQQELDAVRQDLLSILEVK